MGVMDPNFDWSQYGAEEESEGVMALNSSYLTPGSTAKTMNTVIGTPPSTLPPGQFTLPPKTPSGNAPAQPTPTGVPKPKPGEIPKMPTDGPVVPGDVFDPAPVSGIYNPWGRIQGAENNLYGPSQDYLGQATMEATALANAYFAPQRMELAYELGDMETDMRRLAVNLGRQTDDPVLQAKLYKEGMRAVRTLDVQNNTLAFQMSESRRKEEQQNFQFYDQLAQEEARLRMANRQFYDNYRLEANKYNVSAWQVNNPMPADSSSSSSGSSQTVVPQEERQEAARGVTLKVGTGIYGTKRY